MTFFWMVFFSILMVTTSLKNIGETCRSDFECGTNTCCGGGGIYVCTVCCPTKAGSCRFGQICAPYPWTYFPSMSCLLPLSIRKGNPCWFNNMCRSGICIGGSTIAAGWTIKIGSCA